MSRNKPTKFIIEAESYHPDSRLAIKHNYSSGSFFKGTIKNKEHIISVFSLNALNNIIQCLNNYRSLNKDFDKITKADLVSIPLEYYQENLNKRCFNSEKMRDFISFYLNVKSFYQPLLSIIPVPHKLFCQNVKQDKNEGCRFSSQMLSCIQWIEMKHKLRSAFNGDVEAQQQVLSFLEPSFEYAEENKPQHIIENTNTQLTTFFKKENINGYLRINSSVNDKSSYLNTYSIDSPYILVNNTYTVDLKSDVKLVIAEKIYAFHAFSTINTKSIYEKYPECNETNWFNYVPSMKFIDNNEYYNTKYDIFIVHTQLNKSEKVESDLNTLEYAYKKAEDFIMTLSI